MGLGSPQPTFRKYSTLSVTLGNSACSDWLVWSPASFSIGWINNVWLSASFLIGRINKRWYSDENRFVTRQSLETNNGQLKKLNKILCKSTKLRYLVYKITNQSEGRLLNPNPRFLLVTGCTSEIYIPQTKNSPHQHGKTKRSLTDLLKELF